MTSSLKGPGQRDRLFAVIMALLLILTVTAAIFDRSCQYRGQSTHGLPTR